jgi:pyruvate,orthophosphate dikinase
LDAVQDDMSSEFGSPENPLLLSVRSGAAISMPGMVSTLHRTY